VADHLGRGPAGEDLAGRFLRNQGLTLLQQGYRCRLGELDWVCRADDTLIVVEVRARAANAWVGAIASIGKTKQRRIVLATRHLLMTHPQWAMLPIRFDVVGLTHNSDGVNIEWIQNAFSA
jgi:putative endonuclease